MPDIESSTIKVPPQLAEAGPTIDRSAGGMSAELAVLWNRVAALEGTWEGAAHGQYSAYKGMWHGAAEGLFGPSGVLPAIAHIMKVVWQNYASGEDSRAKTWQI